MFCDCLKGGLSNKYIFLRNLFSKWTPFQHVYYTLTLISFENKNEVDIFLCAHDAFVE